MEKEARMASLPWCAASRACGQRRGAAGPRVHGGVAEIQLRGPGLAGLWVEEGGPEEASGAKAKWLRNLAGAGVRRNGVAAAAQQTLL